MNLDKFKYKTTFSSQLKCVIDKNSDKYLAKASLDKLKKFIPEIDLDKQFDLLPISSVGFHVNRANLNGDTVDTKTALEIKDYFIQKYISLEHKRSEGGFGLITNVTFTEFESDKELKEEELKDKNFTFSAVIGGLIWKVLNPKLTEIIEESNDPNSPNYLIASISYELAFSDFNILKIKGYSRDIEDGEVITNKEEISKIESYLVSNGGSGKIDENTRIYRILAGEVIPLGISIVQRPANNSPGIAVNDNKDTLEEKTKSNSNITKISQNQNNSVIENDNLKDKEINKAMTIKTIKELTDENLKECKASTVIELFENGIKEADEKWRSEKESKDKAIAELEDKSKKFMTEAEENKKKLDEVSKKVEELNKQALAKEMVEKFNTRMSYFDSEYELDDEDRGIIKDDIKEMSDEVFAAYSKKMGKLLKNKKKGQKKDEKHMMDKEEMDKNMSKASIDDTTTKKVDDTTKVVDGAVDNAQKANSTLPNTNSNINEDWQSKYKDAFKFENCVEVGKSRK